MNRMLQYFNLAGILALIGLSAVQWTTNSRLNLDINRLEQIRIDQQSKIEDQDKTIKQDAADLDDFRLRLTLAESALKRTQSDLSAVSAQRDQLKITLAKWVAAVAQRDLALKQASQKIQTLAAERNKTINQFNDLANKYNALVKQMNPSQVSP